MNTLSSIQFEVLPAMPLLPTPFFLFVFIATSDVVVHRSKE